MADDPALVAAYVYAAVRDAGGNIADSDLVKAVAIAGRESGWDHGEHNPNTATGDDSWGWFQINILGDLKSRLTSLGITTGEELGQPWNNARAFAQLYNESGFYAWGPYKHQSELAGVKPETLAAAQKAVADARDKGWLTDKAIGTIKSGNGPFEIGEPGHVAGPVTDARDAAGSALDFLKKLVSFLTNPAAWRWIGIGAIGVLLVIGAVAYANKDTITKATVP